MSPTLRSRLGRSRRSSLSAAPRRDQRALTATGAGRASAPTSGSCRGRARAREPRRPTHALTLHRPDAEAGTGAGESRAAEVGTWPNHGPTTLGAAEEAAAASGRRYFWSCFIYTETHSPAQPGSTSRPLPRPPSAAAPNTPVPASRRQRPPQKSDHPPGLASGPPVGPRVRAAVHGPTWRSLGPQGSRRRQPPPRHLRPRPRDARASKRPSAPRREEGPPRCRAASGRETLLSRRPKGPRASATRNSPSLPLPGWLGKRDFFPEPLGPAPTPANLVAKASKGTSGPQGPAAAGTDGPR